MSHARLTHLADLLESGDDLPPATAQWLRECLRRWSFGLPLNDAFQLTAGDARRERDSLLRENLDALPATAPTARAKLLAGEIRRIHSGRQTAYPWLRRADSLCRLPETPRQLFNILR